MKRTQIQLPDRLFEQVKRRAAQREWSVSEFLRRGAEYMVSVYPDLEGAEKPWTLPVLHDVGPFLTTHEQWRELTADDEAGIEKFRR